MDEDGMFHGGTTGCEKTNGHFTMSRSKAAAASMTLGEAIGIVQQHGIPRCGNRFDGQVGVG